MLDNKSNDSKTNEFLNYLLHLSYNKKCADCGREDPSWASLSYGFFVCYDCSAIHRSLGGERSKVKSIQMDHWTIEDLRRMYVSGNKNVNKMAESNEDFTLKYKNTRIIKEIDLAMKDSQEKEPGNSFMQVKTHKSLVGKAKVLKQSKMKFSDFVSSSEDEIQKENVKENKKENKESESSDEILVKIEKPTENLKKSVNPSRSPFSFTVKEIEENDE